MTSRPSINTAPDVGRINPASSESSVLLPQPDWPTMATNSPAAMEKPMSRNASVSPCSPK